MIDTLSVISNGLIANDGYKIIDPLGYFVILIEEVIEEVPTDAISGGGIIFDIPYTPPEEPKTKIKRIRLRVKSKKKNLDYDKEIVVGDINLSVSSITVVNENSLLVEIKNPTITDTKSHRITISISD